MSYRLGVDVGGTFTDLALFDVETNRLEFAKTPSTPANQAIGVIRGTQKLIERSDIPSSDITFFIHRINDNIRMHRINKRGTERCGNGR